MFVVDSRAFNIEVLFNFTV